MKREAELVFASKSEYLNVSFGFYFYVSLTLNDLNSLVLHCYKQNFVKSFIWLIIMTLKLRKKNKL